MGSSKSDHSSSSTDTFPRSAIETIKKGKTAKSSSAEIISFMARLTGSEIESAANVMDGFWDYVADRQGHWRKDNNCLTIPNFGTFHLQPKQRKLILKIKQGKMKLAGTHFIYRNHTGRWKRDENSLANLCFKLSPSVNEGSVWHFPPSDFHRPSTAWTEKWSGKGLSHLSVKRRICVYIHEQKKVPLDEVCTLLQCLFEITLSALHHNKNVSFARRGIFTRQRRPFSPDRWSVTFKLSPPFAKKAGLTK